MRADDHLRRLRDDDRWTDDAPPRETAVGARSVRRVHPPLVPVLATIVTAVLLAVVGGAVLLHGRPVGMRSAAPAASPSGSTVVPWVATTPAPTPTTGVDIGTAVGRAPLCALSQLTVTSHQGGTAMGTWRSGVTLTNRSGAPCELTASGLALQALSAGRYITFGKTVIEDPSGAFRLEPGRTAHFWGNLSACYQTRHFSTEVLVPMYLSVGGERVRLAGTVPNDFRPLCAHPDAFGGPSTFEQEGDVVEATSPFAGLGVTMAVPQVVRPGEVVEYTVTLFNPTASAIRLAPCPTYDQDFSSSGAGGRAASSVTHYVLNCESVPALAPGASATFAMRTVIPAAAHGEAKISWSLDGDPSATVLRTIRAG